MRISGEKLTKGNLWPSENCPAGAGDHYRRRRRLIEEKLHCCRDLVVLAERFGGFLIGLAKVINGEGDSITGTAVALAGSPVFGSYFNMRISEEKVTGGLKKT